MGMSKGINADSHLHISVIFLVKILIAISALIATYYNIQNKFASLDRNIESMHEEIVVLSTKVASIESKHIDKLEEENKSLMQRLGLKR